MRNNAINEVSGGLIAEELEMFIRIDRPGRKGNDEEEDQRNRHS